MTLLIKFGEDSQIRLTDSKITWVVSSLESYNSEPLRILGPPSGKVFSWPCEQPPLPLPPRGDYPHDNFGFLILADFIFLFL
jgi:hypothetical protein